jgi:hypothetical protein
LSDIYLNCSNIKEREEGRGREMIIGWANKRIGKKYERKK